jgi:cell wall-associated NlpC family hydrolase
MAIVRSRLLLVGVASTLGCISVIANAAVAPTTTSAVSSRKASQRAVAVRTNRMETANKPRVEPTSTLGSRGPAIPVEAAQTVVTAIRTVDVQAVNPAAPIVTSVVLQPAIAAKPKVAVTPTVPSPTTQPPLATSTAAPVASTPTGFPNNLEKETRADSAVATSPVVTTLQPVDTMSTVVKVREVVVLGTTITANSTIRTPSLVDVTTISVAPNASTTTTPPTTVAPTTTPTLAPSTLAPTTLAPTTLAQTTLAQTTLAQTTLAQTTLAPSTTKASTPTSTKSPTNSASAGTILIRPILDSMTTFENAVDTTPPTDQPPTTAAAQVTTTTKKIYVFAEPTSTPPAPHPMAQAAVDWALAQVGQPYLWGGEGVGGFDCSGLSLMAWRSVGVSLAHNSQLQFRATDRVALADAQPGDLVFYGDPIHHLGIYIGNGKMVEAPRTGLHVRVMPIKRRDLVGIGRIRA